MRRIRAAWASVLIGFLLTRPLAAQELEPRALINTPIGMNFVVGGVGYVYGNILLDPALPIEDLNAKLWTFGAVYARSISVFGLAGKIGGAVPYATGTWSASVAGADTSVSRTGFGDPVLKLSVNFIGSPALPLSGFRTYRQSTVAGFSLAVTAPLGQYIQGRLINLGSNRWTFTPRLGASKVLGSWYAEAYLGATFFTANTDFFGGQRLTQSPLFDTQAHLIRLIRGAQFWAAGSLGYVWGGRSSLNGVPKTSLESVRASLTLRVPVSRQHGIKAAYVNGISARLGGDFDSFGVTWQYTFGGKK